MEETPPTSLNCDDEADLKALRGIANGDRNCFRELYAKYDNLLFSIIQKILNDREDSEEVLQEVSFSLWRKAHLYHPGRGRPLTWLTSLARNRAIDRLRAKQRQAKLKSAYTGEMEVNPGGKTGIGGYEAAKRRDNCKAVRIAVTELSPLQRQAIEMSYFDGLTQKEIAGEIGQPVGTVKARIRRGLQKLRENGGLC